MNCPFCGKEMINSNSGCNACGYRGTEDVNGTAREVYSEVINEQGQVINPNEGSGFRTLVKIALFIFAFVEPVITLIISLVFLFKKTENYTGYAIFLLAISILGSIIRLIIGITGTLFSILFSFF